MMTLSMDILVSIIGNAAYEILKSKIMTYKVEVKSIDKLILAINRATENLFSKYGSIIGNPEGSFLAHPHNWNVLLKSILYSQEELVIDDFYLEGFGIPKEVYIPIIKDFINMVVQEMHTDFDLDKILVDKANGKAIKEIKNAIESIETKLSSSSIMDKAVNSLLDYDINQAENIIAAFVRPLGLVNPDPNWRFKITVNDEEIKIVEEPINQEALEGPIKINTKIVIPEELKYLGSFRNVLEYGRKKQIPLVFELKEAKMYKDSHLVEHFRSKYKGNYKITIPPTPYPLIKANLSYKTEFEHMFTLQVMEITDDGLVRLSNEYDKNVFVVFNMLLDLYNLKFADFNIYINEDKNDQLESILIFNKVLFYSKRGATLCASSNVGFLFSANLNFENDDVTEETLGFIEDIYLIQDHFKVQFCIKEEFNEVDYQLVNTIKQIINYGVVENKLKKINQIKVDSKKTIDMIIKNVESGIFPQFVNIKNNQSFFLWGQELNVGEEYNITAPIEIIDIELLKKKNEMFSEGDSISISTKIGDDAYVVSLYPRYTPKRQEEFYVSPFVLVSRKD